MYQIYSHDRFIVNKENVIMTGTTCQNIHFSFFKRTMILVSTSVLCLKNMMILLILGVCRFFKLEGGMEGKQSGWILMMQAHCILPIYLPHIHPGAPYLHIIS